MAKSRGADIVHSAGVTVIAGRLVVGDRASDIGLTPVVGAGVVVVRAFLGIGGPLTHSANAGIVVGADIVVIAPVRVVGMRTAGRGGAGVIGADIAVITPDEHPGAEPACAGISVRALVLVVASRGVRSVLAPDGRLAQVISAELPVVADYDGVRATEVFQAGVGRAGVVVVAVHRRAHALAGSLVAGIVRAIVLVVAVDGRRGAVAGRRIAGVVGAEVAVVAENEGRLVNDALGVLAHQRAIAEVAVLVIRALGTGLAVADVQVPPFALAVKTSVRHGAQVVVIARSGVFRDDATGIRLAGIVGAGVVVVAGFGSVFALSRILLAEVARAQVVVVADDRRVEALAGRRNANFTGAEIAVVAEVVAGRVDAPNCEIAGVVGAGVGIRAVRVVRRRDAADRGNAGVQRAGDVIGAVHRRAYALAGFLVADIGRAQVAVLAAGGRTLRQRGSVVDHLARVGRVAVVRVGLIARSRSVVAGVLVARRLRVRIGQIRSEIIAPAPVVRFGAAERVRSLGGVHHPEVAGLPREAVRPGLVERAGRSQHSQKRHHQIRLHLVVLLQRLQNRLILT